MYLRKHRNPELTDQVKAITRAYMKRNGLTLSKFVKVLNTLLDEPITRQAVGYYATGIRVPPTDKLLQIIERGNGHLVEDWALPIKELSDQLPPIEMISQRPAQGDTNSI